MIRDVYLHGAVGRRYGRHWRLDVTTPAEAVRAIMTLRPEARPELRRGAWRVIVGPPRLANAIAPGLLGMRVGRQPIHLVPATQAAGGGGGVGKIIVGVVLIGAAIVTAGLTAPAGFAALGAAMSTEIAMGITFNTIALAGGAMVLGGIAGLLAAQPQGASTQQATDQARPDDRPSFFFNGVTNNSQQGGPVPLVFGTHLVGSIVASGGINVEDIAV